MNAINRVNKPLRGKEQDFLKTNTHLRSFSEAVELENQFTSESGS